MSILIGTAHALAEAVGYLQLAFQVVGIALGLWALADCTIHRADHYVAAGRRSKGFWMGLNAAGFAVILLMGQMSLFGLLGMVANAVYLADVRPALQVYRPIRVRSRIRRSGGGGSKGRWR
ncbi:DUF2516 family protein [Actinomyces gaoshouyii]|uniref:DUF2516 family protein n=1 Tax=Actinomyces gaoshouyii TaxID=1960083 RepID=UPI0009C10287|nr:DUF2516 family protein [Actinomyces gaoshouyii]ARD42319.1 hypothetical protein B6G06_08170 [Actinomyces gaoshouyii]